MDSAKVTIVGDRGVGKTFLSHILATGSVPTDYLPCFHDNFIVDYEFNLIKYYFIFYNLKGCEEYYYVRRSVYTETSLFLLCFSFINKSSFQSVKGKWIPELQKLCPEVPILIIGTHCDDILETNLDKIVDTRDVNELVRKNKQLIGFLKSYSMRSPNRKALLDQFFEIIFMKLKSKQILPFKYPIVGVEENEIYYDIKKLYNSKDFSDITFIIKKQEFYVHQIVLFSRILMREILLKNQKSQYFTVVHDEKGRIKVQVNGIIENVFEKVLKFLYLYEITLDTNEINIMMNVAKYLCLDDLYLFVAVLNDKYYQDYKQKINEKMKIQLICFFKNELNKKWLSDVKFKTIDDQVVYAHKSILSNRCEYFNTMFKSGFQECGSNTIDLDIPHQELLLLLEYLYSGKVLSKELLDNGLSLLVFANQYGLPRLVHLIELKLTENWDDLFLCDKVPSISNPFELLKFCKLHNADQLYRSVLHSMALNYSSIVKMKEFRELKKSEKEYIQENQYPPNKETECNKCSIM